MVKNLISVLIVSLLWIGCTQKASPEYIKALDDHRANYKADFKKNERAPLQTDEELALMDFFEADEGFKCACEINKSEEQPIVTMATYAGKKKDFKVYGNAKCKARDGNFEIILYTHAQYANHPIYSKQLFLPFKDLTSGETTYGGGRYIDLSTDDIKNGILTIDFNHCYNPWCVYASGYSCPIPPQENDIPIAITAGEKMYKGEYKERS